MIETTITDELTAPLFDEVSAFLSACPYPSYQQYPEWPGAVGKTTGHRYCFALCREDGAIIGFANIRRTAEIKGFWLATSQRGPMVAELSRLPEVIRSMSAELARANAYTWQLAPRARGRDLPIVAAALRACGGKPLPDAEQSLHSATGVVWLDKPEEDILAGFAGSGRRRIRQAERAGVEVRRVQNDADLALFEQAVATFSESKEDYNYSLPQAAQQYDLIARYGGAMHLAFCGDELLGVSSFVRQGSDAINWALASTGANPKAQGNAALVWAEMRAARAMGCECYDFAGMPVAAPTDEGEAGRMQFKNSFRPHKRPMVPMHTLPVNALSHAVLFNSRQALRRLRA